MDHIPALLAARDATRPEDASREEATGAEVRDRAVPPPNGSSGRSRGRREHGRRNDRHRVGRPVVQRRDHRRGDRPAPAALREHKPRRHRYPLALTAEPDLCVSTNRVATGIRSH